VEKNTGRKGGRLRFSKKTLYLIIWVGERKMGLRRIAKKKKERRKRKGKERALTTSKYRMMQQTELALERKLRSLLRKGGEAWPAALWETEENSDGAKRGSRRGQSAKVGKSDVTGGERG